MKKLAFSLLTIAFASYSFAADLDGEELFSIEKDAPKQALTLPAAGPTPEQLIQHQQTETKAPVKKPKAPKTAKQPNVEQHQAPSGNLPLEFVQRDQKTLLKTTSSTALPGNIRGKLKGIRTGDILFARIPHSILAFPDENAPVIAEVTKGPFKGSRLLGASTLEPNSKRVFIEFKYITTNGQTYELLANAVTTEGQPGFVGEYHSQEGSYFAGDFVSSFVAAYFNGLVPRSTNVFGQVTEDYSPDSALKKGMAAGAMASAERFREKLKKVPEFSELKGPIDVGLLIATPGVQQ